MFHFNKFEEFANSCKTRFGNHQNALIKSVTNCQFSTKSNAKFCQLIPTQTEKILTISNGPLLNYISRKLQQNQTCRATPTIKSFYALHC